MTRCFATRATTRRSPSKEAVDLKDIKRQFYAFRNGVVADSLRKAGDPHHVIFGLNLPQLAQIAQMAGQSVELAEQLWQNVTTRESRLLAPMVYPRDQFDAATAVRWAASVECVETADIFCHKLLRYTSYAEDFYIRQYGSGSDMARYLALRLAANLLALGRGVDRDVLGAVVQAEIGRGCKLTAAVAAQLLDESDL